MPLPSITALGQAHEAIFTQSQTAFEPVRAATPQASDPGQDVENDFTIALTWSDRPEVQARQLAQVSAALKGPLAQSFSEELG